MIESIKKKLGYFALRRHLKKNPNEQKNFNQFITESKKFLVILPDKRDEIKYSYEILNFLVSKNKEASVFLPKHVFDTLKNKNRFKPIFYDSTDISRINYPAKQLTSKLKKYSFDVVLNLSRENNLFYTSVTNIVRSKFRIGFTKRGTEKYYNLQIPNQINTENSYRNLLNSLRMF